MEKYFVAFANQISKEENSCVQARDDSFLTCAQSEKLEPQPVASASSFKMRGKHSQTRTNLYFSAYSFKHKPFWSFI